MKANQLVNAIRARNSARFNNNCYDCGHSHDGVRAQEDVRALLEVLDSTPPFECDLCHYQFGSRAHADNHECPPQHPATYPFGAVERPLWR